MHINYLEDDDLAFLPECSEAHLEAFTRILTHGENGKPRLSSTPSMTSPKSGNGYAMPVISDSSG